MGECVVEGLREIVTEPRKVDMGELAERHRELDCSYPRWQPVQKFKLVELAAVRIGAGA